MPQAVAVVPCEPHRDKETHAVHAAALLATQSLEDRCLAERVERALRATGYAPLRAVEVSACGRLIILRGRVPSYYMKQLARAAALEVPGVRDLRNDVEVVRPS